MIAVAIIYNLYKMLKDKDQLLVCAPSTAAAELLAEQLMKI